MARHRHQEFIRFLNWVEAAVPAGKLIHAILDNYAAHKHPKVRAWLACHPRWTLTVSGFATRLMRVMGLTLTLLFLPEIIMAQECPVSAPLILKETQAGVVGETGTVWTIAPDCSFTVARQIGSKLFDPHKHGHLTAEQQARLKKMLDQMGEPHAASLPAGPPHVNPHRITLSYGKRQAVLTLPAGDLDSARLRASMGNDRARSMLDLAAAMKDMLGH